MEKNQENNNIVPNWDEAQKENQKPHSILVGMSSKEVRYPRKTITIKQKLSDFENKSKSVDLLELLKTHMPLVKGKTEELRNMTNEQVDTLMSNTNPPLFTNFNPLANLNNEELENSFELTKSDFDDEMYKNRIMAFLDTRSDIRDLENLTEEQAEIIKSNLGVNFFMNIHETDDDNLKNLYDKRILTLRKHNGNGTEQENQIEKKQDKERQVYTLTDAGLKILANVKLRENIIKEGLLYGLNLDDETYRNRIMEVINCSAKEPSKDEIARIFREVRKYGTIPSEKEFKEEAKKLKVSGNFSSLGAAQNELAKRYGYKEYRAIKSKFSESLKSIDEV